MLESDWKILFLDDHYLQIADGAQRIYHRWEKESDNPIIKQKYKWEGIGRYSPTVVKVNDDLYAMWYVTFGGKENDYPVGLLLSEDGINWHGGEIPIDATDDGAQGCVCLYDKGENFGDDKYLGIAIYRANENIKSVHVSFKRSKDGIHWRDFEGRPNWIGPSDVISCSWDEAIGKYVMYYKLWKLEGMQTNGKPFLGYFPSLVPHIKEEVFQAIGRTVLPERQEMNVELKLRGETPDDGGGGITNDSVCMIRIVARAESSDFIHWEKEKIIAEPPVGVPTGDQSYGMTAQNYCGMYVAAFNHFNAESGQIQPLLAWSYNGVDYNVNYGFELLECTRGEWDGGMISAGYFLENIDGRICMYYGGVNQDHKSPHSSKSAAIGRAWMRKEGFVSLMGGIVRTIPITATKGRLALNMRGEISIKVYGENCCLIGQDKVQGDHTDIVSDLSLYNNIGERVQIELDLNKGEIFSLYFV